MEFFSKGWKGCCPVCPPRARKASICCVKRCAASPGKVARRRSAPRAPRASPQRRPAGPCRHGDRPASPRPPAPCSASRLGCAHDSVNEVRALFIHASPAQCSCSSAPCKGRSHWKKYQPNFRQPKQNQNQTKVSGMCFYHVGRPVRGGNATKPSWDIPGLVSYPYHSDQAD